MKRCSRTRLAPASSCGSSASAAIGWKYVWRTIRLAGCRRRPWNGYECNAGASQLPRQLLFNPLANVVIGELVAFLDAVGAPVWHAKHVLAHLRELAARFTGETDHRGAFAARQQRRGNHIR